MSKLQTARQAAIEIGIARQTIARWLKDGKLKGKKTKIGHLTATLVSVSDVRKLKAAQPRGRPRAK
jgi:predicted site-specific integrase-resolvase